MNTDINIAQALPPPRSDSSPARNAPAASARPAGIVSHETLQTARAARQDPAEAEQRLPPGKTADDKERLEQAVTRMNDFIQNLQRDLRFEVDEDLGRTVISVVDSETQEVIRQIPPETVLERARRLQNSEEGYGLLIREQA